MAVDLGVAIGHKRLRSPLILGSFDPLTDAAVLARCFELCGEALGAVITKSTTLDPRAGYPEPRVAPCGTGLLIASGNPNPGIEAMAREIRQFRKRCPDEVVIGSIVNDADQPGRGLVDEFCLLARKYAEAGVDGLELNLSCPHLDPREKVHTIVPAQDPRTVERLVGAVKSSLSAAGFGGCLVIPKLTGWNCNPGEVAAAAQVAGADAVTVSNLFPGTAYHTGLVGRQAAGREIGSHLVAHGKGGYSGKAMQAPVLLIIESLRQSLRIPILATGGCAADLDSFVQAFMAGAAAVESVTPFYFRDATGMDVLLKARELIGGFTGYLKQLGLASPDGLYRLSRGARHAS